MDALRILWDVMLAFWPVTLLVLVVLLVRLGVYLYKTARLSRSGIADLDKLNGEDFERYLEILFKKLGYQVQRTPYQGDYGADLVLRRGHEEIAVQAKRYKRTVGVKAVQEAVTAKDYYGCNKAMVVTNSTFSRQARTLAKANRVELWDRDELVGRLLALKKEPTPAPTLPVTPSPTLTSGLSSGSSHESPPARAETAAATCAHCGKPVSDKERDYCLAKQATFGGRIYCYPHQKEMRRSLNLG